MLYHLLYPLREYFHGFNVFRYITFRAAYALITALVLSFLVGPWLIRKLRQWKVKDEGREDAPGSHLTKGGTPTMGGLLILLCIAVPTLLWADLTNHYIWITLGATIWLGAVGFADDYLKRKRHRSLGLVAGKKFGGQILLGIVVGAILLLWPMEPLYATRTNLLFLKNYLLELGLLYIPFVVVVIVGATNAVNLTDGLDGLAIGVVLFAAAAYAGMCYVVGNIKLAEYLNVLYLRGSGELTVFCATMIGASLGFLWFNAHPAEVFMGDTGALALGGALGTVAVLIKQELLLLVVGGVFVIEALSVIIQVGSFKLRGKRVFKMSPLHHHFELMGWSESKIVVRFWILAMIFALVALSTLKIR
jgi:phospho-N-acetylmuramoyl-pentapeptide-transferase